MTEQLPGCPTNLEAVEVKPMCTRIPLLIGAAVLCLVLGTCVSAPSGPPVDIRFTVHALAPDLTVSSVKAVPSEDEVTFAIEYTSSTSRRFSFFNPPNGDVFKVLHDMPSGNRTAHVTIPKAALKQVPQIGVVFFVPDVGNAGSLLLNYADIEPLLEEGVLSVPTEPLGSPVVIRFTVTWQISDLTISSITARAAGNSVVFTFAYSSSQDRNMYFFDHPNGSVFKQNLTAPAKPGIVSVTVPKDKLRQVAAIAANFVMPSGAPNMVHLNFVDIKRLLEEGPAPALSEPEGQPEVLVPSEPLGPPIDIRFTKNALTPDLTVSGVKARPGETTVNFSIEYTSSIDRRFSFFDPPRGDVFMELRDVPANSHAASVSISKASLRRVTFITVKFFAPAEAGYLFLNYADIKPLLE